MTKTLILHFKHYSTKEHILTDHIVNKAQAINFNCLYPLKGSFKPALSSLALFTFFGTMRLPLSSEFREKQGEACDNLFHSAALKADKQFWYCFWFFFSVRSAFEILNKNRRDTEKYTIIKLHVNMNVSLISKQVPSVCMLLLYDVSTLALIFPSPSPHARRCLCHKSLHSGIHLMHRASRSISHPPVKKPSPASCASLFTLLLYSLSWTYTSSPNHSKEKNRFMLEHKMVAPPFKHWAKLRRVYLSCQLKILVPFSWTCFFVL